MLLKVSTQWFDIGLQLGLEESELNTIEYNNPRDLKACVRNMFSQWLRSTKEPSYQVVLEALIAAGDESAAQELCHKFGKFYTWNFTATCVLNYTITTHVHPNIYLTAGIPLSKLHTTRRLPPFISQYAGSLKELYSSDNDWPLFPPGDWPPKSTHTEFYVNLELIHHKPLHSQGEQHDVLKSLSHGGVNQEDDCYHLQHLMLADIVKTSSTFMPADSSMNEKGIRVLIDGAPGVGKTSLARKACKEWANGNLWPEYNLVVYLPLKDSAIASATELWQLFESDSQETSQGIAKEVARVRGNGVLFILDGWDELSEHKDASVIKKIVYKKVLQKCSLVITSRPHASTELVRYQVLDCQFEIVGLTSNQIKKIVANHFSSKLMSETFLKQMEVSGVMQLCYIPLNLAIVLHVYNQQKDLPHTLTELYDIFMKTTFTRQLNLCHLDSIASLPSDAAELYKALGKLAFDGLKSNSLIFSEDDLKSTCSPHPSPTFACHLGLLTAFKCCVSTGIITKYQFTHLTIQEFLAAEHLATLPEEEREKFIVEHVSNEKFLVMLQFLFGRTSLKDIVKDFKKLFAVLYSPADLRRLQILLRLAHEAQNEHYFNAIRSRMKANVLSIQAEDWNDHEISLLAHFVDRLQWSSSRFSIYNVSKHMNDSKLQSQINCLHQLIRHKRTTAIEIVGNPHQLHFMLAPLTNEGFVLSEFELHAQHDLFIGKIKLIRHGSTKYGMNTLEFMTATLDNSHTNEGFSRFLSHGICPQSMSIMNCHLLTNRQPLIRPNMTSVFRCIAAGLQELHLNGYVISPHNAALLFGAISASSDLRVLDLALNLLFMGEQRSVALDAFVHMLTHSKTLESLSLKECEVDEEVLSLFALHNSNVKVLNLDCTHKIPRDINFQLLSHNLSTLYLSHCYLDDNTAVDIGSMLSTNATLKELYLDRNNITAGGAIHIFVGLMENKSLNCLSIGRQTVEQTSDESEAAVEEMQNALADTMAAVFQTNSTLLKLSLAVFPPYPGKKFAEFNYELKIKDNNTKEHIERAHRVNCMHYDLKFFAGPKSLPVVLLPAEDILSMVQQSSLRNLDLSGHNMTEPLTMHSLITFLQTNRTVNHLKLDVCRLHELNFAPMQKELFNALCNNPTLTDLSVDPESASTFSSLVDKVNYERHTRGTAFLTVHTNTDFYDLTVKPMSHSSLIM